MNQLQDERKARDVVAGTLRAFADRDEEALTAFIHPRGRFAIRSADEVIVGRAGVRRYLRETKRKIVEPTVSTWIAAGNGVWVLGGRLLFQHVSDLRDAEIAWRVEVRDGMLWRVSTYDSVDDALAGVACA